MVRSNRSLNLPRSYLLSNVSDPDTVRLCKVVILVHLPTYLPTYPPIPSSRTWPLTSPAIQPASQPARQDDPTHDRYSKHPPTARNIPGIVVNSGSHALLTRKFPTSECANRVEYHQGYACMRASVRAGASCLLRCFCQAVW